MKPGTKKADGVCEFCRINCSCKAGECGAPNCPSLVRSGYSTSPMGEAAPGDWLMYKLGYDRAIRDSKPLLVWVGETCSSCENQWTQYIHCRVSTFDSSVTENPVTNPYSGPGVLVMKPDGSGGMTIVSKLEGIPSLTTVQTALATKDGQTAPVTATQLSVFRPIFQPMMMPMMGGFGGGGFCGGGGCGGGG